MTHGTLSPGTINNLALEGLLSLYKGQEEEKPLYLGDFAQFRNSNTGAGDQSGRRMSITNAMDILRDRSRLSTMSSH